MQAIREIPRPTIPAEALPVDFNPTISIDFSEVLAEIQKVKTEVDFSAILRAIRKIEFRKGRVPCGEWVCSHCGKDQRRKGQPEADNTASDDDDDDDEAILIQGQTTRGSDFTEWNALRQQLLDI